jgi:hypothetical protein
MKGPGLRRAPVRAPCPTADPRSGSDKKSELSPIPNRGRRVDRAPIKRTANCGWLSTGGILRLVILIRFAGRPRRYIPNPLPVLGQSQLPHDGLASWHRFRSAPFGPSGGGLANRSLIRPSTALTRHPLDRLPLEVDDCPNWIVCRMEPAFRIHHHSWYGMHSGALDPRVSAGRLLLVIVAALWLRAEPVRADSRLPSRSGSAAHECKCRTCRGAACCCGHSDPSHRETRRSDPPGERRATTGLGACLGEAPCGDPGLPNSAPPGPTPRAACLSLSPLYRPLAPVGLLPPPTSTHRPSGWLRRIERPPRTCRSA